MMTVNFGTPLKSIDGKLLMEGDRAVVLGQIVVNALLAEYADEPGLQGEEKLRRWKLAQKAYENRQGEVDVSPEDVVLIKKLVGKAYGPLLVGQAYELLDQKG